MSGRSSLRSPLGQAADGLEARRNTRRQNLLGQRLLGRERLVSARPSVVQLSSLGRIIDPSTAERIEDDKLYPVLVRFTCRLHLHRSRSDNDGNTHACGTHVDRGSSWPFGIHVGPAGAFVPRSRGLPPCCMHGAVRQRSRLTHGIQRTDGPPQPVGSTDQKVNRAPTRMK